MRREESNADEFKLRLVCEHRCAFVVCPHCQWALCDLDIITNSSRYLEDAAIGSQVLGGIYSESKRP